MIAVAIKDMWKGLFRKEQTSAPKPNQTEIGYTGSRIFSGLPMEEYNPELSFPQSTRVYDKMRRSDGQIAAVLTAMKLPIISTKWYVAPCEDADDEELAQEIADFISDNLFGGMKYSWSEHLREALLMLDFGFSVFEKVYRYDEWNGRSVIMLDKYAPRVAPSIWRFPQDENYQIAAVEQINYLTGEIKTIPIERCRIYTYQREGDNIVGISVLRPAYKHWYIKDSLYKIVSVGIEKNLVGTPYAKVPKGTSEKERKEILSVLSAIRAAEEAGFTIPENIIIEMLESSRNAVDALPFIEHHDTQIARSVLAQFINLGTLSSASGGSYALGNTMVDMFCMGLESIANYIQQEVQKDIEELVAWNFGPDAPMPSLQHKDISFKDMDQVAQALYWLGAGKLVTTDESLEDYIRDLFGIPSIPREAIDSKLQLPESKFQPDIIPDDQLTPEEIQAIRQRIAEASQGGNSDGSDGSSDGGSAAAASNSANSAALHDHEHGIRFSDGVVPTATNGEEGYPSGTVKWRRDLTPLEKVVKFSDINDFWNTAEQKLTENLQGVLRQVAQQLIRQIEQIVTNVKMTTNQKLAAINAIDPKFTNKYRDTLVNQLEEIYQAGVQMAASELGKKPEDVKPPQSDLAGIKAKAEALTDLQMQKVTSAVKLAAIGQVQRDVPTKQLLYGLKQTAEAYITGPDLKTSGMITVAESLNIGRGSAAKEIGIQGAQWSAVLDSKTCPLCEEMDGQVISVDNPDFDIFRPPVHAGCRCIMVYIGEGQSNVEFDWKTPDHSLVKRYGHLLVY